MTYTQIAYLHLASILPAFAIGTFMLFKHKGSPLHKIIGRIYLLLMLMTGFTTLFMSAKVGPSFFGHFGFIHLFSLLIFYSVPAAYFAARRGNIKAHSMNMVGLYVGGILISGAFVFVPGRMLHEFLFQ